MIHQNTVLIAGGSGLIGRAIYVHLTQQGFYPIILSRKTELSQRADFIYWDPYKKILEHQAPLHVKAVINLCGENIGAEKWSPERKKSIIDSRVIPTTFLAELITTGRIVTPVYIGTSAVGYYGDRKDEWCNEQDTPADHAFLTQCCIDWENAHDRIPNSVRKVILRLGVVLSPDGGLFKQYEPLMGLRMVPFFGGGTPYISWVDIRDVARAYHYALTATELNGTFNIAASMPETSRHFAIKLQKSTAKKGFLRRVPNFALRWLMGEQAQLVLTSQRVSNRKIKNTGFGFDHEDIEKVFTYLLHK